MLVIKVKSLDKLITIYIILLGVFYGYFNPLIQKIFYLLTFLITIICFAKKKIRVNLKSTTLLIITVVLGLISTIQSSENSYLLSNVLLLIFPVLIIMLLCSGNVNSLDIKTSIFNSKKVHILLNAFWIINLVIISFQVSGRSIFIKDGWLQANSYYPDLCCGLFGFSATHQLSYYANFMLLHNQIYISHNYKNKKIHYVLNAISMIYFFILSVYNENVAVYLLTLLTFASYLYIKEKRKPTQVLKKIGKVIRNIFIAILIIYAILQIPFIKSLFINNIYSRIYDLRFAYSHYSSITSNGSNERIATTINALKNSYGWLFGTGLGEWNCEKSGYLGYRHFGINSMSSLITLGGIWFYLALTIYYTYKMNYLVSGANRKKGSLFFCTLMIIFSSFYTNFYTAPVSVAWLYLMALSFSEI